MNYSLVEGGYTGESNLDVDPEFADISTGDYSLASSSPCIDGGDSTLLPSDASDLDGDSDTEEILPIDLARSGSRASQSTWELMSSMAIENLSFLMLEV